VGFQFDASDVGALSAIAAGSRMADEVLQRFTQVAESASSPGGGRYDPPSASRPGVRTLLTITGGFLTYLAMHLLAASWSSDPLLR
jgi:hypothetical protein